MGVAMPSDRTEWWFKESACFLCMDEIPPEQAVIYWQSAVGHVNFHVDCARRFALHLAGDAREADLCSGDKQWTGRAKVALKRALTAQENRT